MFRVELDGYAGNLEITPICPTGPDGGQPDCRLREKASARRPKRSPFMTVLEQVGTPFMVSYRQNSRQNGPRALAKLIGAQPQAVPPPPILTK